MSQALDQLRIRKLSFVPIVMILETDAAVAAKGDGKRQYGNHILAETACEPMGAHALQHVGISLDALSRGRQAVGLLASSEIKFDQERFFQDACSRNLGIVRR